MAVLAPHPGGYCLANGHRLATEALIGKANANETKPIIIAGTTSLSGRFAEVGQRMEQGFRLRTEQLKQTGGILGRSVEVIIEDDRSDAVRAEAYYEDMLGNGKVDFVLSPYGGIIVDSVARITEKYRVPMLACSVTPDLWTKGHRYLLGVAKTASYFLEGAVDLARKHGFSRIAIVGEDMEFTRSSAGGTMKMARERGLELVYEQIYQKGQADIPAIMEAVRASGANALFIYAFLEDSIEIVRYVQANDLDLKLCVVTAGGLVPEFLQRLGSAAEFIVGPTPWEPVDLGYPGATEFISAYRERFGEPPSGHTALAYASLLLLQMGIEQVGGTDREAVRDALVALKTITFFGDYQVDPQTGEQIGKTMHMFQNLGGRRRVIWPVHAREVEPVLPQPSWANRMAQGVA